MRTPQSAPEPPAIYWGETAADFDTLLDKRQEWTNDFDTPSLRATSRTENPSSAAKSSSMTLGLGLPT